MNHKEDLSKVSFALFLGKVIEEILLETISKGKLVIWLVSMDCEEIANDWSNSLPELG